MGYRSAYHHLSWRSNIAKPLKDLFPRNHIPTNLILIRVKSLIFATQPDYTSNGAHYNECFVTCFMRNHQGIRSMFMESRIPALVVSFWINDQVPAPRGINTPTNYHLYKEGK